MGVLDAVLAVFSGIATWFTEAVPSMIPMFWADNNLTFLGVLSVASLGVAIILMIVRVVINFLQFRG